MAMSLWSLNTRVVLIFILLSSTCGSSEEGRWWAENARRLRAMTRYMLGEDPLLLSGKIEGDILPDKTVYSKDIAEKKNAVVGEDRVWPGGIVPYQFSTGYSALPFERYMITRAMSDMESKSCVRFVKRTNEEDYVSIVFDTYKCYSNVGRRGGKQILSLGMFCVLFYDRGNVYHEILHTLGFHHEHNRPDRDQHLNVIWSNIRNGADKNFVRRDYGSVDVLDLPYDLDSVMHYSPHAFSKVYFLLPTLSSKDRGIFFTRSQWPSELDYAKLNRLYQCHRRDGYPFR